MIRNGNKRYTKENNIINWLRDKYKFEPDYIAFDICKNEIPKASALYNIPHNILLITTFNRSNDPVIDINELETMHECANKWRCPVLFIRVNLDKCYKKNNKSLRGTDTRTIKKHIDKTFSRWIKTYSTEPNKWQYQRMYINLFKNGYSSYQSFHNF